MKKKIRFEDAQVLHQQYPDTFYAPDERTLKEISQGDLVKVCAFEERFWAEVISVKDGTITARIDNDLINRCLKYNEIIDFETRHVYNVIRKALHSKIAQRLNGSTRRKHGARR
jgi:hypothetical protein